MSRHRSRSDVASDSRKAVAVAGTRGRGGLSGSAHRWTERTGKLPEDQDFRPGKTASKRRK